MDDVLAQVVIAAGDPHLVAGETVGSVILRLGTRDDVRERRAGLRLGEAHRSEEPAFDHRPHVGVDLL